MRALYSSANLPASLLLLAVAAAPLARAQATEPPGSATTVAQAPAAATGSPAAATRAPTGAASGTAAPAGATGAGGTTAGTAASGTTLTWWGHAAFFISTPGGANIAIDPWLENPSAPKGMTPPGTLDTILITHGHSDHSGGAAQLAKRTGARVVAAAELSNLIGAEQSEVMSVGGSIKIKDATIRMVEAVHGSGYNVDPKNVRYGGPPVGYVITVDRGPSIYHAGDTDAFSSMALIAERYKPTVALLPVGGHFTMDPAGAALAARLLRVKTVIPMHYGTFPMLSGTPAELRAELKKQHIAPKVIEMKPGDTNKL